MEFDNSNVPFLRLSPPHSNKILTIRRDSDGPALISMLNHPDVYVNLAGPPFPYTQSHYDAHIKETLCVIEMALSEFIELKLLEGRKMARNGLVVFHSL
jgi:hypothetical protein